MLCRPGQVKSWWMLHQGNVHSSDLCNCNLTTVILFCSIVKSFERVAVGIFEPDQFTSFQNSLHNIAFYSNKVTMS